MCAPARAARSSPAARHLGGTSDARRRGMGRGGAAAVGRDAGQRFRPAERLMKALVEAALVGTARQPDRARAALAGDLPVDALLTGLDDTSAVERRVLLAAALHDTYARAGRMPRSDVDVVQPAGSETRPACAPPVAALLAQLLDTRDPLLANILPRVLGVRGRWLVALTGGDDWLVDDAPDPAEARRVWE